MVFSLSSSPTQFSAWKNSLPFMCQVELSSLHKFPPASLFHSALLGGLHCYYPHCTTGALLKSSHTLSFQKTSVGLKTFCKAHLMGQPDISDLTVNSYSLLAVHPAVITNYSIQNKILMVIWRTEINSEDRSRPQKETFFHIKGRSTLGNQRAILTVRVKYETDLKTGLVISIYSATYIAF